MRPVLNCHAVADHHETVVDRMLLAGQVRISHAAQDQRQLADSLRQDDGFGLGRREFQGCIGSGDDALPIFLLKILADRENANIGQDDLADEGIVDALARSVLVMKNMDYVESVVRQTE